ncbi:unnamed protein product [Peniophora sp. CBMAI 1063]|nr:unnamed protein product [Peniophora sp. CBMAI 1063]
MSSALQGWHPGELALQLKLGFAGPMTYVWSMVEDELREQHQVFHTTRLPFIPLTTLDSDGRPWACMLSGAKGEPGFVTSPNVHSLRIKVHSWDGDPLIENLRVWQNVSHTNRFLVAGLGIELPTRRRNKFAGSLNPVKTKKTGEFEYDLHLDVNQALGNCPKYINIREFVPHPDTNPSVLHRVHHMDPDMRLPHSVIDFIHRSDQLFLATIYRAKDRDSLQFPSHAGLNHRGGLPGFVRVRPSDGRSIVIPDYSGNRFMQSLGNIEATPLAGLMFCDFITGDMLYITGSATTLLGEESLDLMPRQPVVTVIDPTGFVFVRDALPVRQAPGTKVIPSPYSPPIKLLREEKTGESFDSGLIKARISKVVIHTHDLATFWFDTAPGALKCRPGQAVALDFSDLLGKPEYAHMAPLAPSSINDDRVRTWTVSSAGVDDNGRFAMTMREKQGGMVTGWLFSVIRKIDEKRPEVLDDMTPLSVDVGVVGVDGDFVLPEHDPKVLFIAGGIGITPFMSMLSALSARGPDATGDVVLALATREPLVMLKLVRASLTDIVPAGVRVHLDIFTNAKVPALAGHDSAYGPGLSVTYHKGRIPSEYWKDVSSEREVMICGPGGFADNAIEGVRAAGVPNEKILREGFAY